MTQSSGCSSKSWRAVIVAIAAGASLGTGCAKKAGSSARATEAPSDAVGMAEESEPEEAWAGEAEPAIEDLEAQLLGYEDGLLAAGITLPDGVSDARVELGAEPGVAAGSGDDGATAAGDRCIRICDLSTNICELRDHICDLADDHSSRVRYRQACERATLDCDRAEEACEGCDE